MPRHSARLSLAFLVLSLPAIRADGIRLANFKDGETIRYPVAILQGTLDDKNARAVNVLNQTSKLPNKEIKGIAYKGRFKALAELVPGPNKLLLRSGTKELTVTLNYKPQTNPYIVQVIYMTDRKGDTKYQTQKQNDPQNYRAKLDTVMKLLQSYTAERMNELGYGRLTFNLEFDKDGKLDVHTFPAEEPAQFFFPLDDVPLFLAVRGQVEKKFHDPHTKRAVFTGFSRFDPVSGKIRANTGRGGGGTAVCGTAGMWAWPGSLAEVFPAFADRTPVNTRLVADDSDGRSTVWGVNGTYAAVMLHELMHTWGLPHSKDTYDVIANRGFRNINRFFSFVEPPSKANPRFFEPPDNQATYIAPMSGASLKNSRWFALDNKTWKDGGAPRITASGTEGDILIESEHGLGYLGFDFKDEAVGHKTWGFGDREPPRRYVLTAAELKELAGASDVRIRAVDLQGQQSEAESKKLFGK